MAAADRNLTFYTHSLCPYAHRVSLCLAEKAIPHKREHIDLSNKPRWYLDLNRRGLVPAIQLDGEVKGVAGAELLLVVFGKRMIDGRRRGAGAGLFSMFIIGAGFSS